MTLPPELAEKLLAALDSHTAAVQSVAEAISTLADIEQPDDDDDDAVVIPIIGFTPDDTA